LLAPGFSYILILDYSRVEIAVAARPQSMKVSAVFINNSGGLDYSRVEIAVAARPEPMKP
jgi:hypothetical protein